MTDDNEKKKAVCYTLSELSNYCEEESANFIKTLEYWRISKRYVTLKSNGYWIDILSVKTMKHEEWIYFYGEWVHHLNNKTFVSKLALIEFINILDYLYLQRLAKLPN